MEAGSIGFSATLDSDVRTFQRTNPGSILLTKFDQLWLKKGETYQFGPTVIMSFDHRDHNAAQVLDIDSNVERFVLLAELNPQLEL